MNSMKLVYRMDVEPSAPARRSHSSSRSATVQEAHVKLTLLGSESYDGKSPTLYATDRGTCVVQGWRVIDLEVLAAMKIPNHETAVEVPMTLFRFLPGARD